MPKSWKLGETTGTAGTIGTVGTAGMAGGGSSAVSSSFRGVSLLASIPAGVCFFGGNMESFFFAATLLRCSQSRISSPPSALPPNSSGANSTATQVSPAVNIMRAASRLHVMSVTPLRDAPRITAMGCARSVRHTDTLPSSLPSASSDSNRGECRSSAGAKRPTPTMAPCPANTACGAKESRDSSRAAGKRV